MIENNLTVPILMAAIFAGVVAAMSMSVFHISLLWGIGVSSTLSFLLLLCFGNKQAWGEMAVVLYK